MSKLSCFSNLARFVELTECINYRRHYEVSTNDLSIVFDCVFKWVFRRVGRINFLITKIHLVGSARRGRIDRVGQF